MKKLVSIILALAMILALSTTAFAAENTSITINGEANRTYNGYQLLTLTTSLKEGAHHPDDCDGTNHTDKCYNYAYKVNGKYKSILQQETLDNGRNALWDKTGKPATAAGVTDEQILAYLEGQTAGDGTMRQVADRIYRAIKADTTISTDTTITGTTGNVAQGYWMFADVTDLNNQTDLSNSLVMVDTIGQDAITINPKTALPTIEKKVKDIDDTEDSKIEDNEWLDTADHDIGDLVPFKLTATLSGNAVGYQSYKLIFHDDLADGLTVEASTVQVLMYESQHKANADFDMNDGKDVTDKFTIKTEGLVHESCDLEVGCDNVFGIEGVTKDTTFVVYYKATLNENAVIGEAGNDNKVYLEYSNDPYGDSIGKTEEDKVTVYTYQLKINKIDGEGHALEGAEFTLYKKVLGEAEPVVVALDSNLGENPTTFTWTGLDDGDYILKETKVPAGYNGMTDIEFTVTATHSELADGTLKLTALDGGKMGLGDTVTGVIDEDIVNRTGSVLPETGAEGTFFLISGGALLVMVATVFMITRKKMSVYED